MSSVSQSIDAAFPTPWLLEDHYQSSTPELVSNLLWLHVVCKPTPTGTDSEKDRHVYNCLMDAADAIDYNSSTQAMCTALAHTTSALCLDIQEGESIPSHASIAGVVHRLLNYELERIANPIEGASV
jgi:hypothetical protein